MLAAFKPLRWLALIGILLIVATGCARTVERNKVNSRRVLFQFSVQGNLALSNPNVTYYIVINAPKTPTVSVDAATQGPRINGSNVNFPNSALEGRLPFTNPPLGADVESIWTHFYFIQGSADGKGTIGLAHKLDNGSIEIVQRNYADALWSQLSPSTLQIQLLLSDLGYTDPATEAPANLTFNLASSDNFETGYGFVFDWWKGNLPFAVNTAATGTPISDTDITPNLVLRQIPGKPIPTLPTGVQVSQVNIIGYEYRVLEL